MESLTTKIVLIVLASLMGAILAFLAAWFWRYRTRVDTEKKAITDRADKEKQAVLDRALVERQEVVDRAEVEKKAILDRAKEERDKLLEQIEANSERIRALETAQAVIASQVVPLNLAMQSLLVKELTHFHTPIMDALMAKLGDEETPRTITEEEEAELNAALKQRMEDMSEEISDNERDAAAALPIFMRRVKRELAIVDAGKEYEAVKVVGIVREGEEDGPHTGTPDDNSGEPLLS